MRIRELLEGNKFNDLDFLEIDDSGHKKISFDIVEDLTFFMNNDDDVYRHLVYPSVSKCLAGIKANKKTSPSIFEKAVREAYTKYVASYPLRELPDEIDGGVCEQACKKMHEETCKNASEGQYKD
jgi:hypothetical protein